MLAGLSLFWRLQGTLGFLVFSGFQRLPAFLGLWSLPPSKPAVTSQVSLPLHPSDHCLHHLLLDSQSSASLLHFQGFSPSFVPDSATPWAVACQALLSMGFSRQEYWSGLPFPSPGDFPNPGIEPGSPALQADSLLPKPPGQPKGDTAAEWAGGPLWLYWAPQIIQDNFPLHSELISNLNFIYNHNSPMPHNRTHSEVQGIRAWTALGGGHHSAYHTHAMHCPNCYNC